MASDHNIELTGESIVLRPFRLDDAEPIYESVIESLDDLLPWLPWCHRQYSIDETRAFLEGRAAAYEHDEEYAFAIEEKPGGRFVGACGINQIDQANRRANLGYWMRSSATRRGYATACTLLLAEWAFETLELRRLEMVVAVGNEASARVAVKAGAQREGVARRRLNVRGNSLDATVFSLVPEDVLPE